MQVASIVGTYGAAQAAPAGALVELFSLELLDLLQHCIEGVQMVCSILEALLNPAAHKVRVCICPILSPASQHRNVLMEVSNYCCC